METAAEPRAHPDTTIWHTLAAGEACAQLGVERSTGLDVDEVGRRRAEVGPNKLEEAKKEPGWRAFLRQYRDLMQLVLLGAAIVSIAALQEFSTGHRDHRADRAQRHPRPEPGGQGRRERRRPAEDAAHPGARPQRAAS